MGRLSIVLVLSLASLSSALLDTGECPPFENVAEFDISLYLGRWFEYSRFFASFEVAQSCVTADYGPINSTTVSVTNHSNFPNGTMNSVVGTGTATDVPGQLIIEFSGVPVGHYNVIGTDYDDYSCVYSCAQLGERREHFAWLLARRENLEDEFVAEAMEVFVSNGVDVSLFQLTPQGGDCVYAPLPELPTQPSLL